MKDVRYQRRQRSGGSWMFILYLILAFYFINKPFQFVKIPEFIASVEIWIMFIGGVFLILGGINSFKLRR
jgi:hypothetical protein